MVLSRFADSGNIPVLEKLMAFVEARQAVLNHNIANIDTPGYRTKHLDARAFQRSLSRAITERGGNPRAPLEIEDSDQFHVDDRGRLVTQPGEWPSENILFHDRTNARIEVLMAQAAENVMTYRVASQLLLNEFSAIKTAIRGEV